MIRAYKPSGTSERKDVLRTVCDRKDSNDKIPEKTVYN